MSIFTNESTIQGRINKLHYHDGGDYGVLYLTIGIKSGYKKGNTERYESINAQINVKLDKEGNPTSLSAHPKSKLNLEVFKYLYDHALKGMMIQLKGNLRGTDLVYINELKKWKVLNELSEEERNDIAAYKNETFLYIEYAQLLERKEKFLKRQKESKQTNDQMNYEPKDTKQADYVPEDNDEEEEGIEVIVEEPLSDKARRELKTKEENIEDGEVTVIRRNNSKDPIRSYVPFESTVYDYDVPDFSDPELNI